MASVMNVVTSLFVFTTARSSARASPGRI